MTTDFNDEFNLEPELEAQKKKIKNGEKNGESSEEKIKKLKIKQKGFRQTIDDSDDTQSHVRGGRMKGNKAVMIGAVIFAIFMSLAISWTMVGLFAASNSDVVTLDAKIKAVDDASAKQSDLSNFATEKYVTDHIPAQIDTSGFATTATTNALAQADRDLGARIDDVELSGLTASQAGLSIDSSCCVINISGVVTDSIPINSMRVYVVSKNNSISLNATPTGGQVFIGWNINGNTTLVNSSITLQISTNMNIKAMCSAPVAMYVLTVNSTIGGVASFDGVSPFANGSIVPIHAVADTGYIFTGWTPTSGISSPSSANTNISISAVRNIIANFASCVAEKPILVSPSVGNMSVTNGSIHFTWTGAASTYEFWFGESSGSMVKIDEGLELPMYDWIAPDAGKYYYWKIVGVDLCGSKSTVGYFKTSP